MNIGDTVNLSLQVPISTGWRKKYQYSSVAGVVTEFVTIESDKFVILDGDKAVNLNYIIENNP